MRWTNARIDLFALRSAARGSAAQGRLLAFAYPALTFSARSAPRARARLSSLRAYRRFFICSYCLIATFNALGIVAAGADEKLDGSGVEALSQGSDAKGTLSTRRYKRERECNMDAHY
jgi:hypothetical protein